MIQTAAAHRPFFAELLRRSDARVGVQVAGIVGFAALAALGAEARIWLWEVPITLQTVAVYGAGLFLGGRNGVLAMVLYLAAGLVLPVFAGDAYGLGYLTTSASAGYLLSYPLVALLVGRMTESSRGFWASLGAMTVGALVLFACGVAWLHVAAAHATWAESVMKGAVLFIGWDLAKVWLVAGGYAGLRKAVGA